jgi:hypothetical protein
MPRDYVKRHPTYGRVNRLFGNINRATRSAMVEHVDAAGAITIVLYGHDASLSVDGFFNTETVIERRG